MGFIDGIKARAKGDIKTIVLPESYDQRVIEAASKIEKEGIAKALKLHNALRRSPDSVSLSPLYKA